MPSSGMRTVGLISDTHRVFDPAAAACLRGKADLVLHAGDVGEDGGGHLEVLQLYEQAVGAPVLAVRGNTDVTDEEELLPELRRLQLHGWEVLVTHVWAVPGVKALKAEQAFQGAGPQPHIVVHGHSHIASVQEHGGILYINPGSAGPARFKLKRSVALLHLPLGGPSCGLRPSVDLLSLQDKAPPRLPLANPAPPRPRHHTSTSTTSVNTNRSYAKPTRVAKPTRKQGAKQRRVPAPARRNKGLPAKREVSGVQPKHNEGGSCSKLGPWA